MMIQSPFEADTQLVALQNQGIADVVLSTDTDIVGLGVKWVISTVAKDGKIGVMSYKKLTEKVLPNEFKRPNTIITHDELTLYCNMLGNDMLVNGKKGDGQVRTAAKMIEYLSKTPEERIEFIK
eukprot:scaffold35000_cov272-Skeletonema_dohrnii-CCMP3373.AAC.1